MNEDHLSAKLAYVYRYSHVCAIRGRGVICNEAHVHDRVYQDYVSPPDSYNCNHALYTYCYHFDRYISLFIFSNFDQFRPLLSNSSAQNISIE